MSKFCAEGHLKSFRVLSDCPQCGHSWMEHGVAVWTDRDEPLTVIRSSQMTDYNHDDDLDRLYKRVAGW